MHEYVYTGSEALIFGVRQPANQTASQPATHNQSTNQPSNHLTKKPLLIERHKARERERGVILCAFIIITPHNNDIVFHFTVVVVVVVDY